MKPEFFCCIGAELKDEIAGSLKSSRIFMYRAAESQTIADMLVDGFFNEADDLRLNDLILLYCPEQTRTITYAKVSSVSGGIIKTSSVIISPEDIPIDTTGYSNISGSNLQQIINSIDAEFNKYLKLDGSSTMTGVLKMRASVSFECAVAPYWHGVGLYQLNDNDSVTLLASMEATDGFEPGTNNTYNIGSTSKKWKNLYLAGKAYMSVINNGFDIAIPVTNSADTLALKSEVDTAANSGRMITDTGVWYAKMYSASVVPTGAEYDGTNYADFSQVDNDNNPIIVIYEGQSGSWVETERVTPPANYDGYVPVTKKIWDIVEQTGQQGGRVLWNHQSKEFTPYPNIVDLSNVATTDMDNLTSTGANIANWSSNVSNCITEIPQDIKLELNNGTLTLKAGSKVYVPNGAGVFDEVVKDSDLVYNFGTPSNGQYLVFNSQYFYLLSNCVSGATDSKAGQAYHSWYDTTNNLIKQYWADGSTPARTDSLPVAIITISGGTITSIDQVFNGFGYIGSTVFGLPGVKGLIPDGRNEDGTLKSIEFETSGVLTYTNTNTLTPIHWFICNGNALELWDTVDWIRYDEKENIIYNKQTGAKISYCVCGTLSYGGTNKIKSFTSKTVFRAVDYSDWDYVVSFQRPTAENNYTWYRKYKSGWVEQGSGMPVADNAIKYVTLPVPMADQNYTVNATIVYSDANAATIGVQIVRSTTQIGIGCRYNGTFNNGLPAIWEVKGFAA